MKMERVLIKSGEIKDLKLPSIENENAIKNSTVVSSGRLKRRIDSSFDGLPYSPPSISLGNYNLSVNEGSSITFTLFASNLIPGSNITWEILPVTPGLNRNDFTHSLTGIAQRENGRCQVTIYPKQDYLTEGPEKFIFRFKLNGIVVEETDPITINDTSVEPSGQIQFLSGIQTWRVPEGVRTVSAVCIGGGAGGNGKHGNGGGSPGSGGGGGALAYRTFSVTPGEILSIEVGAGGLGGTESSIVASPGNPSTIKRGTLVLVGANGGNRLNGGTIIFGQGGTGGKGASGYSTMGGGGGDTGNYTRNGSDGGTGSSFSNGSSGIGSGLNGTNSTGNFGRGGGGKGGGNYAGGSGTSGGNGAIRIVWGNNRAYPNTNV